MPRLDDPTMNVNSIDGTSYAYSATGIDHLGATEYTLATIIVDCSTSVSHFKNELEQAIKTVIQSCKTSPRADNLLVRLIAFSSQIDDIHGFKMLENCELSDYDDCLNVGGRTRLYDAAVHAIRGTEDFGRDLYNQDIDVNGILFLITDGADYGSRERVSDVQQALSDVIANEDLESFQTILVGVNDDSYQDYLENFKDEAGLTSYESIADANPASLAKLAEWVSKSIVVQSQSLGSGGGSTPISLQI